MCSRRGGHALLDPAHHVLRERLVDLLRVGQVEGGHDLDKLTLALPGPEPRVEPLLLADGAAPVPFVVVRRVDDRVVRKGEDLGVHAVVELLRAAPLEVRPPASPDQNRVAGEHHVLEDVREAPVGVSRGRPHLKDQRAELDPVAVPDLDVRRRAGCRGDDGLDLGAGRLDGARAGDVIGVAVGVDGVLELEPELVDELEVAVDHLEHGVDEHGFAAGLVGDEVGVGGRARGVEELAEDDGFPVGYDERALDRGGERGLLEELEGRGHGRRQRHGGSRGELVGFGLVEDVRDGGSRGCAALYHRGLGRGLDVCDELIDALVGQARGGEQGDHLEGHGGGLDGRLGARLVALVVEVEPRFGARAEAGFDLVLGHVAGQDEAVGVIRDGSVGEGHRFLINRIESQKVGSVQRGGGLARVEVRMPPA
mmetsp:Transcript_2936/g.13233  ORF Transcript_2936/g.13233 Transcript_2936/m.13233 type:complete len:424 (-) Transcript_2936:16-1287(-)